MADENDADKEKQQVLQRKKKEKKKKKKKKEKKEEKRVKHYSSNHQILLVGDGDFSFSLSLAISFGSASNIVATSLDTYDDLIKKYQEAKPNLDQLKMLGACLLHGVDATNMKLHAYLKMRKFDRIVFNFPHAGFYGKEDDPMMIQIHMNLIHGFFENASGMLRGNGEIHVIHKTSAPFSYWNIVGLALNNSLELIESVPFNKEDYPGYNNKRGEGPGCDHPFPLGACRTFKFRFSPTVKNQYFGQLRQFQEVPIQWQQPEPTLFGSSYIPEDMSVFHNNFHHLEGTSGGTGYNMGYHSSGALGLPEGYMIGVPGAYEIPPSDFGRPMVDSWGALERPSTLPRDFERWPVQFPGDLERPLVGAPWSFERHMIEVPGAFPRPPVGVTGYMDSHTIAPWSFERQMVEVPVAFQRPLVGVTGNMDCHTIAPLSAFEGPVVEESRAVERGLIRGPESFKTHMVETRRPAEHLIERAGLSEAHWMGPRTSPRPVVEAPWCLGNHMQQRF